MSPPAPTRHTLDGHTGPVLGCAVAPDGTWIVSASSDGTLRIWDAATGARAPHPDRPHQAVFGCAVTPDGTWIVSASADETLRIWDAATGATRAPWTATPAVCGCAVSRRRHLDRVRIRGQHPADLGCRHRADAPHPGRSHRGRVRVCGGTRRHLDRVRLRRQHVADLGCRHRRDPSHLDGHTGTVMACAVAPDGTWIVSASDDHTLRIWDAATGQAVGID